MTDLHLSDQAVAAFADGVLTGRARERAKRHTELCAECHAAVAGQREAVWALRAAPAPSLPGGLLERLRGLPETTPITPAPTVLTPDGTAMLSSFAGASALVAPSPTAHRGTRPAVKPLLGAASLLTAVGLLAAGSSTATVSGEPVDRGPAQPPPAAVFVQSGR